MKDFNAWLERESRWSNLRPFGTSSVARSTALISFLSFLILVNDQLVAWLHVYLPGVNLDDFVRNWRVLLLFYGSMLLTFSALLFSAYCPLVIKKYDSAVEYTRLEIEYFWPRSHYLYILDRLRLAARSMTLWQRSINEFSELEKELRLASRGDDAQEAREHLIVLLTFNWHLCDTGKRWLRLLTYVLFRLGATLVAIPLLLILARAIWTSLPMSSS